MLSNLKKYIDNVEVEDLTISMQALIAILKRVKNNKLFQCLISDIRQRYEEIRERDESIFSSTISELELEDCFSETCAYLPEDNPIFKIILDICCPNSQVEIESLRSNEMYAIDEMLRYFHENKEDKNDPYYLLGEHFKEKLNLTEEELLVDSVMNVYEDEDDAYQEDPAFGSIIIIKDNGDVKLQELMEILDFLKIENYYFYYYFSEGYNDSLNIESLKEYLEAFPEVRNLNGYEDIIQSLYVPNNTLILNLIQEIIASKESHMEVIF